ncbi:hypothetical protein PSR1_02696 [Anaeromyxobacter sp. PSR-1]|nr:hypothetical protein PSR1_02696 [Anaeromyxobacter sp. PSR-1]
MGATRSTSPAWKYAPTTAFAAATFASVIPPGMAAARARAMVVSGVTWMPAVAASAATDGIAQASASPAPGAIDAPVASST